MWKLRISCGVSFNAEKLEGNSKNQVVVIKEGEYLLETSVEISEEMVIVGHGKVSVVCKTGEPLRFTTACHVENVEMAKDCDSQEKSQEFSSNDIQPEVIRLATPSGYDNTSNECKVNLSSFEKLNLQEREREYLSSEQNSIY